MFKPKNANIEELGKKFSQHIQALENLLQNSVGVYIDYATARKVSKELNTLQKNGLVIFDIQRIREFICWKNQI